MDLFGPIAYISIGGNKYNLVIVDDYSHFTWVIFLQDEFDAKVKKIRSDNGTIFKKTSLMKKASSMSFRPPILNKIGWQKGRTKLL
jgi:hypothetical protein